MTALGALGEGLVELALEPGDPFAVALGLGGDAPNAAVMASLLGTEARICGRVGADALGGRLLALWEERGIDTRWVVVDGSAATGIYVNERGAEGLHRFDYHRSESAGSRLAPADLGDAFFDGLGVLHLTGITLAVSASSSAAALEATTRARARGALVSIAVNHRPALGGDIGTLRHAAATADVVFVSVDEAASVFGVPGDAVADLLPAAREVVVTRGAAGATVHAGGRAIALPAPAVETVDAAGAGDALAGAYLAARLGGADVTEALATGIAAASLSCAARGCALSYPRADATRRLAETLVPGAADD